MGMAMMAGLFCGAGIILVCLSCVYSAGYNTGYAKSDREMLSVLESNRKAWSDDKAASLAELTRQNDRRHAEYVDRHEQELVSLRQRCIDYMLDRLVMDAEYGIERSPNRNEVLSDALLVPLRATIDTE